MSVDVYLISQIEWKLMMLGKMIVPANMFKVGYSENPLKRLGQLKAQSSRNLALFGIILCRDEKQAREVEATCHEALRDYRRRGEWFKGDVDLAWDILGSRFYDQACWLTKGYDVDLESMQIVPFKKGAWGGISDSYHDYRDYKEHGILSGRFSHPSLATQTAPIMEETS